MTAQAFDRDGRRITASKEAIDEGLRMGRFSKTAPAKPADKGADKPADKSDDKKR